MTEYMATYWTAQNSDELEYVGDDRELETDGDLQW